VVKGESTMSNINNKPTHNEDERYEKLGRTIVGISWFFFALKFIAVASLVALVILYFIGKPLWLAPLIGFGAFTLYRLFWRFVIGLFIKWSR
jgi:hypothetical protein